MDSMTSAASTHTHLMESRTAILQSHSLEWTWRVCYLHTHSQWSWWLPYCKPFTKMEPFCTPFFLTEVENFNIANLFTTMVLTTSSFCALSFNGADGFLIANHSLKWSHFAHTLSNWSRELQYCKPIHYNGADEFVILQTLFQWSRRLLCCKTIRWNGTILQPHIYIFFPKSSTSILHNH